MKDDIATFHKRKAGGHYARVMGTLHRHLKVEKAGDAALGMLARIWSYCADTGRHVLNDRDMAVIMVRDRNGPRKLRALLDARLLDEVEGGYSPHDWFDHNPGIAPDGESNVSGTRVERDANVTKNVTQIVTKDVRRPTKQNQELTHPLSDSGLRTQEYKRENAREDAPPLDPAAEIRADPVSGVVAMPANDSRRAVSSAHVQEWADVLAETFERATPSRAAPKATRDQTWQLAEHCRDLARVHGVSFREAAQKLAQAALAAASRPADKPGERYPFSVLALDPYAATQAAPESYEAYQARRRADPWAGIKQ